MSVRELLAVLALLVMPIAPITGALPGAPGAAPAQAQEPAVEVPEEPPADEDEPWTARYLAPTVVAMGALVLAAVIVLYLARVRGRYRVVR